MATKTVTISWGTPKVEVRKVSDTDGAFTAFATPVDGTTTLETTQGDKMEATVEGGENEAVKYKKSTYELTFDVRQVPERTDPIQDVDGVVDDEYEVRITPENVNALAIHIFRASVNVQTSYSAEEGIKRTYTFSVLKPDSGAQIEYGVASDLFK
jgi:hypothetical protein